MNLHSIDIAVLVAYMGIVLGMGVYFSRRNNNTEEYFLGDPSDKSNPRGAKSETASAQDQTEDVRRRHHPDTNGRNIPA